MYLPYCLMQNLTIITMILKKNRALVSAEKQIPLLGSDCLQKCAVKAAGMCRRSLRSAEMRSPLHWKPPWLAENPPTWLTHIHTQHTRTVGIKHTQPGDFMMISGKNIYTSTIDNKLELFVTQATFAPQWSNSRERAHTHTHKHTDLHQCKIPESRRLELRPPGFPTNHEWGERHPKEKSFTASIHHPAINLSIPLFIFAFNMLIKNVFQVPILLNGCIKSFESNRIILLHQLIISVLWNSEINERKRFFSPLFLRSFHASRKSI